MIYYTKQARSSAKKRIRELRAKVREIPGAHLPYTDAADINKYLLMLEDLITKEDKTEDAEIKESEKRRFDYGIFKD